MYRQVESFVESVQAGGRYAFSSAELTAAVSLSGYGWLNALRRLEADGKIVRPSSKRNFFVIVPPEFRTIGAPPLPWWLDAFMLYLHQEEYYVALLTAAEWHGSAHFAIQETQVIVSRQLRPIQIGRERIRFVTSSQTGATATERKVFDGGSVRVSTPEATALDLVRYLKIAGGPSRVATVLSDLQLTPSASIEVCKAIGDVTAAQRLGYLLQIAGHKKAAKAVERYLATQPIRPRLLDTSAPADGAVTTDPWKVVVNTTVEVSQ